MVGMECGRSPERAIGLISRSRLENSAGRVRLANAACREKANRRCSPEAGVYGKLKFKFDEISLTHFAKTEKCHTGIHQGRTHMLKKLALGIGLIAAVAA